MPLDNPFMPGGNDPLNPAGVPLPKQPNQLSIDDFLPDFTSNQNKADKKSNDEPGLFSKLSKFFSVDTFERGVFIAIGLSLIFIGLYFLGSNVGNLAIAEAIKAE